MNPDDELLFSVVNLATELSRALSSQARSTRSLLVRVVDRVDDHEARRLIGIVLNNLQTMQDTVEKLDRDLERVKRV
jgi:hypothetical protein